MKEYIRQFFNEGFATSLYRKPLNYIKKKVKNESLRKIINSFITIIYVLLVLYIAGIYLYIKLK